jgi:hypothetical protein
VKLDTKKILESTCVCEGGYVSTNAFYRSCLLPSKMKHLKCKHVGALLYALLVLKKHSQATQPPKGFKRPNIGRYEGLSNSVRAAVDADLTWPQMVANLLIEAEKRREGRANNDVFLTVPKSTTKPKKHPATLEAMNVTQLKAILTDLSLPLNGSKADLISRISLNRLIPPSASPRPAQPQPQKATKKTATKIAKKKPPPTQALKDITVNKKKRMRSELDELAADTARFLSKKSKRT